MKNMLKSLYRIIPLSDSSKKKLKEKILNSKNENINTKNQLLKISKKYDVLSFDVFDTLITRRFIEPDDIFTFIEEKVKTKIKIKNSFIEMRKNAEKQAIEKYQHDPNIYEIYNMFSLIYKVDKKTSDYICELERTTEVEFCLPRKEMLEVFNSLKEKGKKIVLTSDMYLDKECIVKMLDKCGYKGYEEFYLSNDLNLRKDTGTIWPYILKKHKNKSILHIGDNQQSDVILPKNYGINTFMITSGREMFKESEIFIFYTNYYNNRSFSDSLFLGNIVNYKLFNSPFSLGKVDDLKDFSYLYIAPVLDYFFCFINKNVSKNCLFLFLAREGYTLQKLYNDYYNKKNVSNKYFLTSRRSTNCANVNDENDIDFVLQKQFNGTLKNFAKQIFNADINNDKEISLPNDSEYVMSELKKNKLIDSIINEYKNEKKNYMRYYENIIESKTPILIDLGYSGSIQYNLSKMNETNLTGVYFTNSESIKKYKKDSKLYFAFDNKDDESYIKLYHYSLVLEFFLTAPYGQLMSFDNKLNPIYNNETCDQSKMSVVNLLIEGSKDYFQEISDLRNKYDFQVNPKIISQNYISAFETKVLSYSLKDKFTFIDSFETDEEYNIFKRIGRY